mmetsp:Transcript_18660/g.21443  ORF Transcript_18660/g.21443 Transcript_18660/m.21443 type:complete len:86 (+) Transcript_18660:442-699(+)
MKRKTPDFALSANKGVSRSVALLAGFMMIKNRISYKEALRLIKSKKPEIDPNIGFLGQLQILEEYIQKTEKDDPVHLDSLDLSKL